jgi:hypothetical protein
MAFDVIVNHQYQHATDLKVTVILVVCISRTGGVKVVPPAPLTWAWVVVAP